jgi:hypothetical protein
MNRLTLFTANTDAEVVALIPLSMACDMSVPDTALMLAVL